MNSSLSHILNSIYSTMCPEETLLEKLLYLHFMRSINLKTPSPRFDTSQYMNWDRMIELIQKHSLSIILSDLCSDKTIHKIFPNHVLKHLAITKLQISAIGTAQKKEYTKILQLLYSSGIDFLVMKTIFYPKPSQNYPFLKVANDLDLLIPISSYTSTVDILQTLQYGSVTSLEKPTVMSSPHALFHTPLTQEGFKKIYTVELHTLLIDAPPFINRISSLLDAERITNKLYQQNTTTKIQNMRIKIFNPTSLVLSHFLHSFVQHNMQGIMNYYEFGQILVGYRQTIDWNYVFNFLTEFHLLPYFYWYVKLYSYIFPNTLPLSLANKTGAYFKSQGIRSLLLLSFMRYKVLHPTLFLRNIKYEREKTLVWSLINKSLTQTILRKL